MLFQLQLLIENKAAAAWSKRGSNSPKSLCQFSSFAPVRAAVEAPPAPSRHHVVGNAGKRSAIWKRKKQSVAGNDSEILKKRTTK